MKAEGERGEKDLPVGRRRLNKGPTWRECGAFVEQKIVRGGCSQDGDEAEEFGQTFLGWKVTMSSFGPMVKTNQSENGRPLSSHWVSERRLLPCTDVEGYLKPTCTLSMWHLPWPLPLPPSHGLSTGPMDTHHLRAPPHRPWGLTDCGGTSRDCELLTHPAGSALGEWVSLLSAQRCVGLTAFWWWAEP